MPEIRLPVFEGPLDLLLHLIERDDLDITAVSLVAVTDQYLAAIQHGNGFDPNGLAEFVSIGAKLIFLKSRALLPDLHEDSHDGGLDEDDLGRELVELLKEYKRFSEVTDILEERQDAGLRLYARRAAPPVVPPGPGLDDVTVDRLRAIMLDVLARKPERPEPAQIIQRDTLTLGQRIEDFRQRLESRGRFSFRQAIDACETRVEVVVAFFAILELLKSGACDVEQSATWGDIEVVAVPKEALSS